MTKKLISLLAVAAIGAVTATFPSAQIRIVGPSTGGGVTGGSCSAGQYVTSIASDGTPTCATPSADIDGGACPDGSFATAVATNGAPTCASVPPSPTTQATKVSALVTGGQVAWVSSYQFRVSAATYYIDGVQYTSAEQSVTLDAADETNPRIDVIAVDDTGTVVKITGTSAATPSEPGVDTGSQLKLAIVSVPAGSTEPEIEADLIFGEGGGSEWNWTTSGTGFNVASTNQPRTGTVSMEGTNVQANAYAQGQIPSGTMNSASADRLVFYIKSKASWPNKRLLKIELRSSGILVGNTISLNNGAYGFDSSITSTYQQVVIPVVHFAVPATATFNQVRFTDAGGAIGFYVDDVQFQGGTGQVQTVPALTQEQADARYMIRANNGLDAASTASFRSNLGLGTTQTPTFGGAVFNGQYYGTEYDAGDSGTSKTIDWANGNQQRLVLTGNVTLTLSNPAAGGRYLLVFTQDGSGGKTVTWPSAVKWSGGVAATLTTTAGAIDLCTLAYTGAGSGIYLAACNLDVK